MLVLRKNKKSGMKNIHIKKLNGHIVTIFFNFRLTFFAEIC